MDNPLYDLWASCGGGFSYSGFIANPNFTAEDIITDCMTRDRAVDKYSWAIPDDEAIRIIKDLGKLVVEVGCGLGYWGRLLLNSGVKWTGIDNRRSPIKEGQELWAPANYRVMRNSPRGRWAAHALLLCWPPYATGMAYNQLKRFTGNTFVYVGEGPGGCTGDDKFHKLLNGDWEEVLSHNIPQWFGLHDYLVVYQRKGVEEWPLTL